MAAVQEEATLPSTMTMKPHLDYATSYDPGTDAVTAIQPVINGEAASQGVLRRPSENLRGRTETLRSAMDDLFYYRDRPAYQLVCAGSGVLDWGGTVASGGTGVLDNTTALTVSPLGGAMANTKGVIGIGTAGTNRVNYSVPSGVYATHGVNRWTIEQRPITGQTSIQVQISDGPNYFILVTYDDTNNSHDAPAVVVAVTAAIAGNAGTAGKLVATADAISSNAVGTSGGVVTFYDGVVSATVSGTPTVDIESHRIPAGALGTLTGSDPLLEGTTILIAYRGLIEPDGGDALDPKGVLDGGRAESNPLRGNDDVTANLIVLSGDVTDGLHLSGAIPLVRILNGQARFIDGTSVTAGYTAAPGSSLGTAYSAADYHGPTTLETNGGLLTSDTTLAAALTTADQRLAERRSVTWTATDDATSIGGDFNSSTALLDAALACDGGEGIVHVRRGTYDSPAAGTHTFPGVVLEGEGPALVEWVFDTAGVTLAGPFTLRNMTLSRVGGVTVAVTGGLRLENCTFDSGLLNVSAGVGLGSVELIDCTMVQTNQSPTPIYGLRASVGRFRVIGGTYDGPDTQVVAMSATPDTRLGVFQVPLEDVTVEILGAKVANDVRAGWRVCTLAGSNTETNHKAANIQLANGGSYRSTSLSFDVGTSVDLSSGKEVVRYGEAGTTPEPSRVVFHPALSLDLNAAPSARTAPSHITPELELVEITDPRSAVVATYVALPASVTITDLGTTWRVAFGADARGTLQRMCEGDVVEIVDSGFYRIMSVAQDAPGSLVIADLDGRGTTATPPAGSQTLRYYRVIRGHIGGLSETGVGVRSYAATEPDCDFLPGTVEVAVGQQMLGGLAISGDNGSGLVVGRLRTDLSPTGDKHNFTPDFLVGRTGGTYARDLFAKALSAASGTISGILELGAVPDVEDLLDTMGTALSTAVATLGSFVNSGGEWNYSAPVAHTLNFNPAAGVQCATGGPDWVVDLHAYGSVPPLLPQVTGVNADQAEWMVPIDLPRGYVLTSVVVTAIGSVAAAANAQASLYNTASPTAIVTSGVISVGATDATITLTPGSPVTVGAHTHMMHLALGLTDTATLTLLKVVANGTIPGPR